MKLKILFRLIGILHSTKLLVSLLFLLLLFAITNEVAIYHIGLITGDYYQILNQKDHKGFIRQTIKSVLLIVAMALLKSLKESCATYLSIKWRQKITQDLHAHYYLNLAYYMLNVVLPSSTSGSDKEKNKKKAAISTADNVDQRLTADVERMTTALSSIVPELLVAPFIIVFYASKCYQLNGLVGPLGCLVFFLISSLLNRLLIANVSYYVYAQEKREGDFRWQHMRVRNSAESIAFFGSPSEQLERIKSDHFLNQLISTQTRLLLHQMALKGSMYLADYLGSILSFIALAVPLFAGAYDHLPAPELSKLISQNAFFTIYLINCFTRLIDLSGYISTFFGTATRIGELYVWFGVLSRNSRQPEVVVRPDGRGKGTLTGVNYFEVKNLTIKPPSFLPEVQNSTTPQIKNLNFTIESGNNLLISGPSGVGKSSLLRTLRGIWRPTSGSVNTTLSLNDPKSVLFLPQRPLITSGSIAEQIVYPEVLQEKNEQAKARLEAILKFLELEKAILAEDNDIFEHRKVNWSDQLSVGEVQRLQLARVLYHLPTVAFLDESTSALPVALEEKIMNELERLKITIVSVGHRNSLQKYHKKELKIVSSTDFEMVDLDRK